MTEWLDSIERPIESNRSYNINKSVIRNQVYLFMISDISSILNGFIITFFIPDSIHIF